MYVTLAWSMLKCWDKGSVESLISTDSLRIAMSRPLPCLDLFEDVF